jgi:HAD superfamily hydrolase (TIGR01509 family)
VTDPVRAVLFDLDGTLTDTNYGHAIAWSRAFRQEGHQVTMAAIHRHIGMGSDRLLDALLPGRDRARDDVLTAAHTEHYASFIGLIEPLPGARELVRAVARRGARVVLATSAPPAELRALRAALDIEDCLTAVTSAADVDSSKPAPDILRLALDESGADPRNAVMVGDTRWDVLAAQRAGIPCVAVLTGGIGADELIEAGASAIYAGPDDLLANVDVSPIGRLLRARRPEESSSIEAGQPGRCVPVADARTAAGRDPCADPWVASVSPVVVTPGRDDDRRARGEDPGGPVRSQRDAVPGGTVRSNRWL